MNGQLTKHARIETTRAETTPEVHIKVLSGIKISLSQIMRLVSPQIAAYLLTAIESIDAAMNELKKSEI